MATTPYKQAPVLAVDRHSGGGLARIQGPFVEHLQTPRIEGDDRVLLFQVHEYGALAISGCELRASPQIDRARHTAVSGIDGGSAVPVTIECKDSLGCWIIDDCVGFLSSLD